jgi:hypothetical protein
MIIEPYCINSIFLIQGLFNKIDQSYYEYVTKDWKRLFLRTKWIGIILIIIGIILIIIGVIFRAQFPFEYFGDRDRTDNEFINVFTWTSIGLIFLFSSYMAYKDALFYKDKISKKFTRGRYETDPSLLIDYYQSVYDLRTTLIKNNLQYKMNVISGFRKRKSTEFQIIGKPDYIVVEPIYRGKYREFFGVTVSVGPNVDISNPDVWEIINIIESAYR